jgi:hypothetical protein
MKLLFVILLIGLSACNNFDNDDENNRYQCPTCPSQPIITPPNISLNSIEFRVNGTPNTVRIRHSTSIDGFTQVITTLPYSTLISTHLNSLFISLDATPVGFTVETFPYLSVQIFVNGALFREAVSSELNYASTITVSGTWRR